MKIDPFRARTVTNPDEGVTIDAKDRIEIDDLAQRLYNTLEAGTLGILREALAREIVYLDDAGAWTESGSDIEAQRLRQQQTALKVWSAVRAALTASRVTR